MTVSLHDLDDDDLSGVLAWCEPLARMESRVIAAWGNRAWRAVRDEQTRRLDGGTGRPWPVRELRQLAPEELALVALALSGVHGAGSPALQRWVEAFGDELTDELVRRVEGDAHANDR